MDAGFGASCGGCEAWRAVHRLERGANLACPTIRTTNDMPIVDPQGFDALGLFPLQINPHFTNALPEGHQGETREQRIRELLVVAPELTIVGLPEGNWIQVTQGRPPSAARTRRCCLKPVRKRCLCRPVTAFKMTVPGLRRQRRRRDIAP